MVQAPPEGAQPEGDFEAARVPPWLRALATILGLLYFMALAYLLSRGGVSLDAISALGAGAGAVGRGRVSGTAAPRAPPLVTGASASWRWRPVSAPSGLAAVGRAGIRLARAREDEDDRRDAGLPSRPTVEDRRGGSALRAETLAARSSAATPASSARSRTPASSASRGRTPMGSCARPFAASAFSARRCRHSPGCSSWPLQPSYSWGRARTGPGARGSGRDQDGHGGQPRAMPAHALNNRRAVS